MDVDEEILEYFEENDWEMSNDAVQMCAEKIQKEFDSEEDAFEYIQSYLHSMFNE